MLEFQGFGVSGSSGFWRRIEGHESSARVLESRSKYKLKFINIIPQESLLGRPLGSLDIFPYWFYRDSSTLFFQGPLKASQV